MSSANLSCCYFKQLKMCWWLIKEKGQQDESYMNKQFTLKVPDDNTVTSYESWELAQLVQISFSGLKL